MGSDNGRIWWGTISGPVLMVKETAGALLSNKNVYLKIPEAFPWREAFIETLIDKINAVEPSLYFDYIDVESDPGSFLIAYSGLEAEYRYKKTPAEFLSGRDVFANRILHTAIEGSEKAAQWYNFAKSYKPKPAYGGHIMIESRTLPPFTISQNIQLLNYDDFVTDYDALVFAGLMFSKREMGIECKRYVAALAVTLFGTDATCVADFIENFNFDHDDPSQIAASMNVGGDVSRRLWNAQIQTLFPLIMLEHREFIDKWHRQVEMAFKYASETFPNGLEYLGEQVTSPEEMELATLHYLMRKKRSDIPEEPVLCIPDEKAFPRLDLLYNMRNLLAHGKVCAAKNVRDLLLT